MMRSNNIEVIESIISWRRAFVHPPQFIQNGVNYLLKIVADLDFVGKIPSMSSALAPISLLRNPFILEKGNYFY